MIRSVSQQSLDRHPRLFAASRALLGAAAVWLAAACPAVAQDADGDGIDDATEQWLLNRFAPITIGHHRYPEFQDPGGAPVSVGWMLRNGVQCRVVSGSGAPICCGDFACTPSRDCPPVGSGCGVVGPNGNCIDSVVCWQAFQQSPEVGLCEQCVADHGYLSIDQWVADVRADPSQGEHWRIAFNYYRLLPGGPLHTGGNHAVPAERRSWARAEIDPEHTYGRAWKPWPESHPDLISLQYYSYYTNNDADSGGAGGDFGDHQGDWGCIDVLVDIAADPEHPPVLHMVFHNHGRQFFMTPEFLPSWYRRPHAYLERGSNEPWPTPGPAGSGAYPAGNGWGTNRSFDLSPMCASGICVYEGYTDIPWSPDVGSGVTQAHEGSGYEIDWLAGDGLVPNIGDNGVSLCGPEGTFLLLYRGRWGRIDGTAAGTPKSPVAQPKMFQRAWEKGPWRRGLGPFEPPPSNEWPISRAGFTWTFPTKRSEIWVDDHAYVGGLLGTGFQSDPYASLSLAIAMVSDHGTLRLIRPIDWTQYRRPRTITRPLTLTAHGGPVTLGGDP